MIATYSNLKGTTLSVDPKRFFNGEKLNKYLDTVFPQGDGELTSVSVYGSAYPQLIFYLKHYSAETQLVNLANFFEVLSGYTNLFKDFSEGMESVLAWLRTQDLNNARLWNDYLSKVFNSNPDFYVALNVLDRLFCSSDVGARTLKKLIYEYRWLKEEPFAENRIRLINKSFIGRVPGKKDRKTRKYCICNGMLFTLDDGIKKRYGF